MKAHTMGWFLPFVLSFSVSAGQPDKKANLFSHQFSQVFRSDSIHTEAAYFQALQRADEYTFKYQFETEFLLLLDEAQKAEYLKLPSLNAKKHYIIQYWKASNPNPLLDQNDWLLDFLRRRQYVRKHFAISRPPYFDDRGKYYLKYGKPFRWYIDAAGYELINFSDLLPGVRLGLPTRRFVTIRPNESWSYENISRNFVVHFMKVGEGYREIDDLLEVVEFTEGSGKYNIEFMAQIWAALLAERAYLSHEFQVAEDKMRWISEGRRYLQNQYDRVLAQPSIVKDRFEKARRVAIKDAPNVAYAPIHAVNDLKLYTRISQFKGEEESTRINIDFLWPLADKWFKNLDDELSDTMRVVFSALFRDRQFDPVDRKDIELRVPISTVKRMGLKYIVHSAELTALPQTGELTVQVQNDFLDKLGFRRNRLRVRDFHRPVVAVSDIQFFAAANDFTAAPFPKVNIQNLELVPYPYYAMKRSLPVYTYYEIYNLQTTDAEKYVVEYKISSVGGSSNLIKRVLNLFSGKKSSITMSYERPIEGDTARELLMIDLKQLKSGKYLVEITVRFPGTDKQAVSAQREIYLD